MPAQKKKDTQKKAAPKATKKVIEKPAKASKKEPAAKKAPAKKA